MIEASMVVCSLLLAAFTCGGEPVWKQMPLRSTEMKAAGFFGGDGFQEVMALRYAPSDPSRVYCAIDCAQMWRSEDGGWSWSRSANGFRANGGMDVAVDPFNAEVVYVAGAYGLAGKTSAPEVDGVYRTLDGGTSWERVLPTIFYKFKHFRSGNLFWIDGRSERDGRCQVVYVASQHGEGIFRSEDGGTTWKNIGVKDLGVVYDFQRNPFAEEFWVSTETALCIVKPGQDGYSTTRIDRQAVGLPAGDDQVVTRVQFNPKKPGALYVLSGVAGLYVSTDGGRSFQPKNKGIDETLLGQKFPSSLDLNPARPEWMIRTHSRQSLGNYQSFDGGETWALFKEMDSTQMLRNLDQESSWDSFYTGRSTAFHPSDPQRALIPGHNHTMQRTIDGGQSWQFSGNGFCGARVGVGRTSFSFPVDRPDELTFFCIDFGPFRSDDAGDTFRTLNPIRVGGARTTPVGAVHPQHPEIVVCPSGHWNEQKLIRTEDGGASWSVVDDQPGKFLFCAFHPQNPSIVYAGDRRSDDGGKTWVRLEHAVAEFQRDNGDVVYAFGEERGKTRLYRSDNRGGRWVPLGDAIPATGIREIAVGAHPERVYVPTKNGLFIFDGTSWQARDERTGLPRDVYGDYAWRNIVVHPTQESVVFMTRLNALKGHSDGLWCSRDSGLGWFNISGNLGPDMTFWAIAVDPRNDRLYAGSSNGTWYLDGASDLHPPERNK